MHWLNIHQDFSTSQLLIWCRVKENKLKRVWVPNGYVHNKDWWWNSLKFKISLGILGDEFEELKWVRVL